MRGLGGGGRPAHASSITQARPKGTGDPSTPGGSKRQGLRPIRRTQQRRPGRRLRRSVPWTASSPFKDLVTDRSEAARRRNFALPVEVSRTRTTGSGITLQTKKTGKFILSLPTDKAVPNCIRKACWSSRTRSFPVAEVLKEESRLIARLSPAFVAAKTRQ